MVCLCADSRDSDVVTRISADGTDTDILPKSPPALLKAEQLAALLTAKSRIAAATYRITLPHTGCSLYFTMGREMPPPRNCPFPLGSGPQSNTLFLGPTHPFNSPFSGTTRVSRYQKGKPIWILLKQETVSGSGISWAIYASLHLAPDR